MGHKGSGKTKTLVELVCKAVGEENGNVVCIEPKKALMYDIPYQARLVIAEEYSIDTPELLRGFLSGLAAGNYDITHAFIDNLFKITGNCNGEGLAALLAWMETFGDNNDITFTLTVSAEPGEYGEAVTKYIAK